MSLSLAQNGREAAEQFIQMLSCKACGGRKCKLILIDMMMPVMTGDEAAKRIVEAMEKLQRRLPVKIIGMSGDSSETTKDKWEEAGVELLGMQIVFV